MRALLEAIKKEQFGQEMAFALKLSTRRRDVLAFRMRPYGVSSYFDFMKALQQYRLKDVVHANACHDGAPGQQIVTKDICDPIGDLCASAEIEGICAWMLLNHGRPLHSRS
jgi:hypothetical protein